MGYQKGLDSEFKKSSIEYAVESSILNSLYLEVYSIKCTLAEKRFLKIFVKI